MKLALLLFVCSVALADAQMIGASATHFMFNYHGTPMFCPRELDTLDMVTCLDDDLKYIICRVLPRELGYIDCGHRTRTPPREREANVSLKFHNQI